MKKLFETYRLKMLSREQQKMIIGGYELPAECSVTCRNGEKKTRDCGRGVSCTTDKTTIYCGSNGQDMCKEVD